jgi:hypothetical protein
VVPRIPARSLVAMTIAATPIVGRNVAGRSFSRAGTVVLARFFMRMENAVRADFAR